jgi:hypothetical protein
LQAALGAVTLQCRPSLHVGLRVIGSDASTAGLPAAGTSLFVAAIPVPCFLQVRATAPAAGSEPASEAPARTAASATALLLLSVAHLRAGAFDLPSLLAHSIAHALLPRVAELAAGRTAGLAAVAERASAAPSARSKGVSAALCAPLAALLRATLPNSLQVLPALSPLPGSIGRSPAAWNPFADAAIADTLASEPHSGPTAGSVEVAVSRTLAAFKLPADAETGSTDANNRGAAADRARGTLGRALHPVDAAAAQLAPTRSFLVGELVAVEVAARPLPATGAAHESMGAAAAACGPLAVPYTLLYGRVEAAAPLSFGVGSLLSVRTRADAAQADDAAAAPSAGRAAKSHISLVQLRSTRVRAIQPSANLALLAPAGDLLPQASAGVVPPAEPTPRTPSTAPAGSADSSHAGASAAASSTGPSLSTAATESAAVLAALRDMLTRLGGAGTADALLVGGGGGQGALAEMLALRRRLADAEGAQAVLVAEVAAARAEIEAAKEAATCAICYTNPVDCVLAPCGHQICRTCERQLTSGRCPFDRRVVQLAVPVFKPR